MKKLFYIGFFISFIMLNSCVEPDIELSNQKVDETYLAKLWFEEDSRNINKASNNSRTSTYDIQWDKVNYFRRNEIELFEVPIGVKNKRVSFGTEDSKNVILKLIIFKKSDKYQSAIMEFIPTEKFQKFTLEDRESFSLKRLQNKFSGLINFSEFKTGKSLAEYLIERGQIIGKLNPSYRANTQGRLDCYEVTSTYWTCSNYGCNIDYQTTSNYCIYIPDQNLFDQSLDPADTSGGGSSSGGSSNDVFELDQTIGRLCDNLNFSQVGRSFTAEVSGLGITANNMLLKIGIHADFGTSCIQIPDYHLSDRFEASAAFTTAFNTARQQIASLLNSGALPYNSIDIRNKLKQLITENLNSTHPGSTFTSGPCSGNIAKNVADYKC